MSITITTVKPDPVPVPPDTYTISGLSLLEIRGIRTVLGQVAPARDSQELTPTHAVFSALAEKFQALPLEESGTLRFKFNGKGV